MRQKLPDGILILGIGDLRPGGGEGGEGQGDRGRFQPRAQRQKTSRCATPNDIYVSRVGFDEYAAGQMAANRFAEKGAKAMICVQEEVGDGTQTERCAGMGQVAKAKGVKVRSRRGRSRSWQDGVDHRGGHLRSHPDAGRSRRHRATRNRWTGRRQAGGLGGRCKPRASDVSPDIVGMIQKGDLDFTMDQQGWWRGYISVLELVHYIRYGLIQSNYFLTGPQIVHDGRPTPTLSPGWPLREFADIGARRRPRGGLTAARAR